MVTSAMLDGLDQESLPSASVQAAALVRLVGNHALRTANPYQVDESTAVKIGASSPRALHLLLAQLEQRNLIINVGNGVRHRLGGGAVTSATWDLSLDGWERFEEERGGRFSGRYGFLAMKFGDTILDHMVATVLKPSIRDLIGYEVIDLRDVARAGVIDNIMRAQIRDSAFVLVDLTHDNYGAYWEAGYAEGLGKPVIYICEQKKFEQAKTHFDTNHCTTVTWSESDSEGFAANLIATLRRSLNLFATA